MKPTDSSGPSPTISLRQPKDNTQGGATSAEPTHGGQTELFSQAEGGASDLCGTTLGVYQVLDQLGRGGMGAVYKARHTRLDKLVALKILPPHLLREPDAVARFEREMRAVGKLEHPHLVRALDAGEAGGLHYLAIELVEGGNLTQLVKKRGPLPVWAACRLVYQAAVALDYAHKQGLVHRDIKPSNLMLTKSGQMKVSDLGLARLTQDDPASEALTHTGTYMGTPDYTAPEQWDDTHTVDGRADLYSLGCTLFFLLTGRAPWQTPEHSTVASKMKAHVLSDVPDVQAQRGDVPDTVDAIYRRLMAKRPEERYASGAELAKDLEPFTLKPKAEAGFTAATVSVATTKADQSAQEFLASLPGPGVVSVARGREARQKAAKPKTASAGGGRVPGRLLAIGGGGLAALLLLGVIIIKITNKDGTVTEIRAAADAKVEVIRPAGSEPAEVTATPHPGSADAPPPAIAPFNATQAKKHQEAWAAFLKLPAERDIELPGGEKLALMLIPPGEFLMGSSDADRKRFLEDATAANDSYAISLISNEAPQHLVRITQPFYLGKYEVTQAQWQAVLGRNPSSFAKTGTDPAAVAKVEGLDTSNHPVENVSWHDSAEFCARLSEMQGLEPFYSRAGDTTTQLKGTGYRLPTEAEWEFACRAGTTTAYWSGDTEADLLGTDWVGGNSGGRTHAVGELHANPFGLYDMHGNVRDWCEDWFGATYYYERSPTNDPTGPPTGSHRVNRGGFFYCTPRDARSARRHRDLPDLPHFSWGFRLAAVASSELGQPVVAP